VQFKGPITNNVQRQRGEEWEERLKMERRRFYLEK